MKTVLWAVCRGRELRNEGESGEHPGYMTGLTGALDFGRETP